MSTNQLPALNACLNGLAAILLFLAYRAIRNNERQKHKRLMLSAVGVSLAFLTSYLVYHYLHGSTRFQEKGALRVAYLGILLTHTVLAAINVPLIVVTLTRALKGNFAKHRRIAKVTFASWMYVSVTGVVIYLMLYQLWPARPAEALAAYEQAHALHREQKDEAALAQYERAAKLGHIGSKCFAAVIRDRVNETEAASATIDAVLKEHPDDVQCLTLEARNMILDGHPDEALPILTDLAKRAPNDAFVQVTLGFAQFRSHQYEEAATAFERSIELEPGLAADVFNAGYSYYLYGNYTKARPLLERALKMGLPEDLATRAKDQMELIDGVAWTCPMHPNVKGKKGDKCEVCGMPLEPLARGIKGSSD